MTVRLKIFSFLLLFVSQNIFDNLLLFSQWQTIQTSTTNTLVDISIVNSQILWVSGFQVILRSSNGGQNWVSVPITFPSNSWHIFAFDNNLAWTTGGLDNDRIFKTTNGGNNWTEQFYTPTNWVNGIHFFNQNTGIILTDAVNFNGVYGFFITRDGGSTWIRSSNSPSGGVLDDNCLGAIDTNLVWFRGTTATGSPSFFKLTGGLNNNWTNVYPFLPAEYMTNVIYKDYNTALATHGASVYKSSDGGLNWVLHNNESIGTTVPSNFLLIPGTDWIFINVNSRIRISYDFCTTWQATVNLQSGQYYYMRALDTNNIYLCGTGGKLYKYNINYIGIHPISNEIPSQFQLYQNYPNPFNPTTKIKFAIPTSPYPLLRKEGILVVLKIYNTLGSEVATLVNEQLQPGTYETEWDASNEPSGVYYYKLTARQVGSSAGVFIETKKMVLVK